MSRIQNLNIKIRKLPDGEARDKLSTLAKHLRKEHSAIPSRVGCLERPYYWVGCPRRFF